jgi:mRNA-degrading endonuclease toxin of MazEF toxin-antitoxin module
MNRGDIYMVSLDPTQGHEQRGHRPVVIISPSAFNHATRLPVILRIDSLPSEILDDVLAKTATLFQ